MTSALIGHSGFVGGNLLQQHQFEDTYNSANIEDIEGRHYRLIVCAGAPGVKWRANQEPDSDRRSLERLMRCLGRASADHLILISTIDVYANPVEVDEDTSPQAERGTPYGRHRYLLEGFVRENFDSTVVRLPGLFGPGLKKNVIYDFLHDHRLEAICAESVFQFYPLVRLWHDLQVVRNNAISLANFATEPTSVRTVASEGFGIDFANPSGPPPVRYDMRTRHGSAFGRAGAYLYTASDVMEHLRAYVSSMGWTRP